MAAQARVVKVLTTEKLSFPIKSFERVPKRCTASQQHKLGLLCVGPMQDVFLVGKNQVSGLIVHESIERAGVFRTVGDE